MPVARVRTIKPADFPTTVQYNRVRLAVMATDAGLTEAHSPRPAQVARFDSAHGYRVHVFFTKTGRISYAIVTMIDHPASLDRVPRGTKRRIGAINALMRKWATMTDNDVLDLTNR